MERDDKRKEGSEGCKVAKRRSGQVLYFLALDLGLGRTTEKNATYSKSQRLNGLN